MTHLTKIILFWGLLFTTHSLLAQFHTLRIPHASNTVEETQRLAITDITMNYHSPAVRGRDVWNDPGIIPQNGDPIPWRAGANMNTTIEFSTDVFINGQALTAGIYGFHVIPRGDRYSLLFAHNNDQWGSYYLDVSKDVSLQVEVEAEECSFSEKLDYEFLPSSENTMIIGLEWADRRLPFSVSVDLNETVVNSFRSELRGINTYHWQAWNDAARWCFDHDTNLEEALSWATRSIEGGYGGFAADKNVSNLTTKARILQRLAREDALEKTLTEISSLALQPYEANEVSRFLMELGHHKQASQVCQRALESAPNTWYLQLNQGIATYFLGDTKQALTFIEQASNGAPERFQNRMKEILGEVESGTYKLPGQ